MMDLEKLLKDSRDGVVAAYGAPPDQFASAMIGTNNAGTVYIKGVLARTTVAGAWKSSTGRALDSVDILESGKTWEEAKQNYFKTLFRAARGSKASVAISRELERIASR